MAKKPVHPGVILHEEVLKPLGLSIASAASKLGVARGTLSRVVNGRSRIRPRFAIRLELAGAGDAHKWVQLQADYDAATVKLPKGIRIRPIWPEGLKPLSLPGSNAGRAKKHP